jgi:hypothetical protein
VRVARPQAFLNRSPSRSRCDLFLKVTLCVSLAALRPSAPFLLRLSSYSSPFDKRDPHRDLLIAI